MSRQRLPGEFDAIARYFAPLAADNAGALGLVDDGAVIAAAPGAETVTTVDMLIAGVHFLATDPPDLIARKLLRVNLSDLAAMGAVPRYYLLAMALPLDTEEKWIEAFAAGLAADQAEFAIKLAGGDTTATPGPMTFSLTAVGEVPAGQALRRSTARVGDDVYVSGTVGDAALALAAMRGELSGSDVLDEADQAHFLDRYRLPRPRVALGPALRGLASAVVDLSDGLVADLGHVCETSGLGAEISAAALPLSPAASRALGAKPELVRTVLSGGDDYELLFAADPASAGRVAGIARECDVPVTRIGHLGGGDRVVVVDAKGGEIGLETTGYRHF